MISFRCGLLAEGEGLGGQERLSAALSNDSTCHNQLWSPEKGAEVFRIEKAQTPPWPLGPGEGFFFSGEFSIRKK